MAEVAKIPMEARRNTPLLFEWEVRRADGSLVDLTDAQVRMQVRHYGAQPGEALIDLPQVTSDQDEGLVTGNGFIRGRVAETSLRFLPLSVPGEADRFEYDAVIALDGAAPEVFREGPFNVQPGVTDGLVIFTAGGSPLKAGGRFLIGR